MKQQIHNSRETWTYTKMGTIREGWLLLFSMVKYIYPRVFHNAAQLNYAGELLSYVYHEDFWMGLSGYEADF